MHQFSRTDCNLTTLRQTIHRLQVGCPRLFRCFVRAMSNDVQRQYCLEIESIVAKKVAAVNCLVRRCVRTSPWILYVNSSSCFFHPGYVSPGPTVFLFKAKLYSFHLCAYLELSHLFRTSCGRNTRVWMINGQVRPLIGLRGKKLIGLREDGKTSGMVQKTSD